MHSQWSAKTGNITAVGWMKRERPEARITRSQLRDPKFLEMASHGLVEIAVGNGEDVAMLPLQSLIDLERICDLANSFVQVTVAASQRNVPRALLGEFAFFADLSKLDQERFLSEFADAVVESIRLGDPRPAAFLVGAYRTAVDNPAPSNPLFSGQVSAEVEMALASKLAVR